MLKMAFGPTHGEWVSSVQVQTISMLQQTDVVCQNPMSVSRMNERMWIKDAMQGLNKNAILCTHFLNA